MGRQAGMLTGRRADRKKRKKKKKKKSTPDVAAAEVGDTAAADASRE